MELTSNSQGNTRFAENQHLRDWLWIAARWVAFLVAVVEIVGLFVWPDVALVALRDVIIPVIPVALLLNPLIWRNVCPLATANMLGRHVRKLTRPTPGAIHRMLTLGIVLFLVLVPARRFLFNQEAAILSATIVALVVTAGVLGVIFDMKSGFCNAFCPVLPVERLYGFSPLMSVSNHRCIPRCTGCAPACIDLSPGKSPRQALGNPPKHRNWALTPFGMFMLSFPGFVLGYFQVTDVPLTEAPGVYQTILLYSLVSLVLLGGMTLLFKFSLNYLLPFLAAAAAGIYYWYSSPTFTQALGFGATAGNLVRSAIFLFIAFWLIRAIRTSGLRVPQPRAA